MIRDERGSVMVEFALVLPLLLLLLLGMVEMGRIFHTYLVIQQTARDAIRHASIGTSYYEIDKIIKKESSTLESDKLTYILEPASSARVAGGNVSIAITYEHSLLVPFLKGIVPDPLPLRSEISMRVE